MIKIVDIIESSLTCSRTQLALQLLLCYHHRSIALFMDFFNLVVLTSQVGLPRWRFPGRTRLPMQETWVLSLGPKYPLEEEMATHSSILTWRIPWKEEPGRLQAIGLQRDTTEVTQHAHTVWKLEKPLFAWIPLFSKSLPCHYQ